MERVFFDGDQISYFDVLICVDCGKKIGIEISEFEALLKLSREENFQGEKTTMKDLE